jgi:hypothetical protein
VLRFEPQISQIPEDFGSRSARPGNFFGKLSGTSGTVALLQRLMKWNGRWNGSMYRFCTAIRTTFVPALNAGYGIRTPRRRQKGRE